MPSALSPFRSTEVVYTKRIAVPLDKAVEFLQDLPALARLSPLIIDVVPTPNATEAHTYTISHWVEWPFSYRTTMSYQATGTLLETGIEARSTAGAGTRITTQYTAREVEEGVCEIQERAILYGLFFFLPYIRHVVAGSHQESLRRMKDHLEGKAQ
ncbi:SWIM-type domain-containing protein [Mycena kentingensis (nom. inval.)]|nr:SWIM-type domain-containing protein [Mycena kentingensis (nom. inval.)]